MDEESHTPKINVPASRIKLFAFATAALAIALSLLPRKAQAMDICNMASVKETNPTHALLEFNGVAFSQSSHADSNAASIHANVGNIGFSQSAAKGPGTQEKAIRFDYASKRELANGTVFAVGFGIGARKFESSKGDTTRGNLLAVGVKLENERAGVGAVVESAYGYEKLTIGLEDNTAYGGFKDKLRSAVLVETRRGHAPRVIMGADMQLATEGKSMPCVTAFGAMGVAPTYGGSQLGFRIKKGVLDAQLSNQWAKVNGKMSKGAQVKVALRF